MVELFANKYRVVIYDLYWLLNVVLLFLFSLHVGGYSGKRVMIFTFINILVFYIFNKKIVIDWNVIVLILAMFAYGIIFKYYYGDVEYFVWWHIEDVIFPPILMYILCKQLAWKQRSSRIKLMVFAICIGSFFYSILNYISYLQEGFLSSGRIWNDFWTQIPIYATEFSYWGVFIVGLLGYGIYCLQVKKWIQGTAIISLIIIENYINIVIDNRMILMVTVVVALVDFLLYIYFNKENRKKLKVLFLLAGIIIAVVLGTIFLNIGGIRNTAYMEHFFDRDGGILKNVRFQMIWEAIQMLPSHWRGGGTMVVAGYSTVHNYWLQVANDTGIFPFTMWMLFNGLAVISIIKLVADTHIEKEIICIFVPLITAVVSYLMMEIGGAGKSDYIIFYVMLIAILNQVVKNRECSDG